MNLEAARRNMVVCQLQTNRVTDNAVLAAFEAIPRERFLPDGRRAIAYVDEDIEIAPRRYLMEPRVLGRMIQSLMPARDSVALVVGCGTGYSAAILSRLVQTVVAVESDESLVRAANANLAALGIDNVAVFNAPLEQGYEAQAPYQAILVDGGVEIIPNVLTGQLADGGRLVAVRRSGPVGQAVLVAKTGGVVSERPEFDAAVPVLPGFERPQSFAF